MSQIDTDTRFKIALQKLDAVQQRVVAALFVEHVIEPSHDERAKRAVKVAADIDATEGEIADALKLAKSAIMDCSTRCGADGDWTEQAGYFVIRAVIAALTPLSQSKSGGPAWQAAMSSRMARTSMLIDENKTDMQVNHESEWQYEGLSNYIREPLVT